jgi:hypothetical protein
LTAIDNSTAAEVYCIQSRMQISLQPSSHAPTVQKQLLRALRRYARRECIVWEGGRRTYAEVHARCRSVAVWLQERTEAQTPIGILLPNSSEFMRPSRAAADLFEYPRSASDSA